MYEFIRNSGLFTRFPVTLETSKFKEGYRSENVIYFIGKTFVLNFFMKTILLSCWLLFLGYFHKIAKNIWQLRHICPVYVEQLRSHWTDFRENLYYFYKICQENSVFTKT